ncbi:hypothetical protein ALC56_14922 [Trachymyrmex septentrionalis]|uniref:Uncharacterized protein n=1 Tax=Trachymyrmex septentrionalis TaxID=34720 RepID=A0A195ES83_9HYME|nr:hypothetical protein ALC56_14922 [Trachymyrmex septentrionalis]
MSCVRSAIVRRYRRAEYTESCWRSDFTSKIRGAKIERPHTCMWHTRHAIVRTFAITSSPIVCTVYCINCYWRGCYNVFPRDALWCSENTTYMITNWSWSD